MAREKVVDVSIHIPKLVEYMKEHSDQDGWTEISSKTLAAILGIGGTSAYLLTKKLEESSEFEHRESTKSNVKKKPNEFKYIGTFKAPVKANVVSDTHPKYKNLSNSEVSYIENIFKKKGYTEGNLDTISRIVNTLAGINARTEYVPQCIQKISDLLLMSAAQVRMYVNILMDNNIVIVHSNGKSIKLVITKEAYEKEFNASFNTIPEITPVAKTEPVLVDEPKVDPPKAAHVIEVKSPDFNENQNAVQNDQTGLLNMLIENMNDFQGFVGQFMEFWKGSTSEIEGLKSGEEVDKLKAENTRLECALDKGMQAVQRSLEENSTLKERNNKLEEELRIAKKHVQALRSMNDNSFEFMQEKFQIVIAEITNEVSKFAQLPAWKMQPSDRAKFQNNIISAITSAVDEIVKNNRSKQD